MSVYPIYFWPFPIYKAVSVIMPTSARLCPSLLFIFIPYAYTQCLADKLLPHYNFISSTDNLMREITNVLCVLTCLYVLCELHDTSNARSEKKQTNSFTLRTCWLLGGLCNGDCWFFYWFNCELIAFQLVLTLVGSVKLVFNRGPLKINAGRII